MRNPSLICSCALMALLLTDCAQAVNNAATDLPQGVQAPKSMEDLKTQCWMEQEKKKNVNNIDAKIAAVDKCIEERKKYVPGSAFN